MMKNETLKLVIDPNRPWLNLLIQADAGDHDGSIINQRSHMPDASPADTASRKKLALMLSRLISYAWEMAADADAERESPNDLSVREAIRRQWLSESDVDDDGELVPVCYVCGEPRNGDWQDCAVCGWIGW